MSARIFFPAVNRSDPIRAMPRASSPAIPQDTAPYPWRILWTLACGIVGRRFGRAGVVILSLIVVTVLGMYSLGLLATNGPSPESLHGERLPDSRAAVSVAAGKVAGRLTVLTPASTLWLSRQGEPLAVRGDVTWTVPPIGGEHPRVQVALDQPATGIRRHATGLVSPDGTWRVYLDPAGWVPGTATLIGRLLTGEQRQLDEVRHQVFLIKEG